MTCVSLVGENWSRILSQKSFNGAFVIVCVLDYNWQGRQLRNLVLVFTSSCVCFAAASSSFPAPLAIGS